MDCSLPSSSVHGILQARILEWVAISFSMLQEVCCKRRGQKKSQTYSPAERDNEGEF